MTKSHDHQARKNHEKRSTIFTRWSSSFENPGCPAASPAASARGRRQVTLIINTLLQHKLTQVYHCRRRQSRLSRTAATWEVQQLSTCTWQAWPLGSPRHHLVRPRGNSPPFSGTKRRVEVEGGMRGSRARAAGSRGRRRTSCAPTPFPPSLRAFKCPVCSATPARGIIFLVQSVALPKKSLTTSTWRLRR